MSSRSFLVSPHQLASAWGIVGVQPSRAEEMLTKEWEGEGDRKEDRVRTLRV